MRNATLCGQTIEAQGRPAELLLVEDNRGDAYLVRQAFESARISNNLSIASDGEQALRMLLREGAHANHPTPDLILLELNLPRIDGQEVLRRIRSEPRLLRIPVIVMSSSKAEIDILKSYKLCANGYIVKPVTFERLSEIVASLETFWFSVVVLPRCSASVAPVASLRPAS